jgi:hypothetical protein
MSFVVAVENGSVQLEVLLSPEMLLHRWVDYKAAITMIN